MNDVFSDIRETLAKAKETFESLQLGPGREHIEVGYSQQPWGRDRDWLKSAEPFLGHTAFLEGAGIMPISHEKSPSSNLRRILRDKLARIYQYAFIGETLEECFKKVDAYLQNCFDAGQSWSQAYVLELAKRGIKRRPRNSESGPSRT